MSTADDEPCLSIEKTSRGDRKPGVVVVLKQANERKDSLWAMLCIGVRKYTVVMMLLHSNRNPNEDK